MLESQFQRALIKELETLFPGCTILKNDANYRQGIPDLLILFLSKFALLEVKASATAARRPNQDYYIRKWQETSFAEFVYPENKQEVLESLYDHFMN